MSMGKSEHGGMISYVSNVRSAALQRSLDGDPPLYSGGLSVRRLRRFAARASALRGGSKPHA
ncbi:MAG: hypothetical protein J7M14_02135, partial [Planctomycetes bacterium]|nr:hypothetical protein [Planctomycetota bacterium]